MGRSLEETPTWAVAGVCAIFVVISMLIEHGIQSLGKWLQNRKKNSLMEALEKIKAELMILGFISLLLTVGAALMTNICIPSGLANKMLPCGYESHKDEAENTNDHRRKLLSYSRAMTWRRSLAGAADSTDHCVKRGKVRLITEKGVHELHIFLFVLALVHIVYSIIIMALSQAKMKKWKTWELETSSVDYQLTHDPARIRFTHQTTFVRRHGGFSRTPGIRWIVAFFRQFSGSVTKVDYITMRRGFINAHFPENGNFNFRNYIKRSMEDDFKMVVGISLPLWVFGVILLLLNVDGWYTLYVISIVPLIILMAVGTKLEVVIMEMAQQIQDKTSVIWGAPVVEPSNSYFWFDSPKWILVLIHYTTFQNAFQMALFLCSLYEYSLKSCQHGGNLYVTLGRVVLGVGLQFLCSYITFPLYALVTQMGSQLKQTIFEEQTTKALTKWTNQAKEKNKLRKLEEIIENNNPNVTNGGATPTKSLSPIHNMHQMKSPNLEIISTQFEQVEK